LAASTRRQYDRSFKKWEIFCKENKLALLPAAPQFVACCVAKVASETGSISAADTLAASIAFEHRRRFLASPTSHESFKMLMQSIRKNLSQPRRPAEPFSLAMIHQFFDHLFTSTNGRDGQLAHLCVWRTVWRIVLEFYTLGRFSDLVRLRRSSLKFVQLPRPHLIIRFEGGKNDQVTCRRRTFTVTLIIIQTLEICSHIYCLFLFNFNSLTKGEKDWCHQILKIQSGVQFV
jgi:hypothetical protein